MSDQFRMPRKVETGGPGYAQGEEIGYGEQFFGAVEGQSPDFFGGRAAQMPGRTQLEFADAGNRASPGLAVGTLPFSSITRSSINNCRRPLMLPTKAKRLSRSTQTLRKEKELPCRFNGKMVQPIVTGLS